MVDSKEFIRKKRNQLRLQEWRKNNKQKCKEYSRRERENRKEIISEKRKSPEARKKMIIAVKRWRLENPEKYKETTRKNKEKNKLKISARLKIMNEIRRGRLIRSTKCEKCGIEEGKMEAHHEDYTKPLEIQWLCIVCHMHKHKKLLDIKK